MIFSYEIVTQAIQPAFADWIPYPVVASRELDEQRGVPWRGWEEGETVSVRLIRNRYDANGTRPGRRPERRWRSESGSGPASSRDRRGADIAAVLPQRRGPLTRALAGSPGR